MFRSSSNINLLSDNLVLEPEKWHCKYFKNVLMLVASGDRSLASLAPPACATMHPARQRNQALTAIAVSSV